MSLRRGLIQSLIGHALLIALFMLGSSGSQGQGQRQAQAQNASQQDEKTIVEKSKPEEKPIEVELKEVAPVPPKKERPKTPHENEDCKDYFGGIGIEIASGVEETTGRVVVFVDRAIIGYPAYEAGIRAMDELIGDYTKIQGEIGTEVEITFRNAEGTHTVKLIRDKICTKIKRKDPQ